MSNGLGHKTRFSDSSLYDEICIYCGATDARGSDLLYRPCPSVPKEKAMPKVTDEEAHEIQKNVERAATAVPRCTQPGCVGKQSNDSSLCPIHYMEWLNARVSTISAQGANERQVGGSHYRDAAQGGEQHWDRMWRMYREAWFVGNITKYVERYREKNGIQDLEKARHYLDKLIELEKEEAGKVK